MQAMVILEKCVPTVFTIMTLAGIGESPFNQERVIWNSLSVCVCVCVCVCVWLCVCVVCVCVMWCGVCVCVCVCVWWCGVCVVWCVCKYTHLCVLGAKEMPP